MKSFRLLAVLFAVFVLVKTVLVVFVVTPTIYSDEYLYAKLARSLWHSLTYTVHEIPVNGYPPLYPLVLSVSYLFQDMHLVYFFMKFLNALLSSLILFPAYFLAKEFVSSRESLVLATLTGLLPASFAFTPYLMAENLFYPLFLTTLYFLYKAVRDHLLRDSVLAGFFLGLTVLTKTLGFLLVPVVAVFFLRSFFIKSYTAAFRLLALGFVALATVLPWLLYTLSTFGFSISSFLGRSYAAELTNVFRHSFSFFITQGIVWFILYLGVFILASGIVFFVGSILFFQERQHHRDHLLLAWILGALFFTVLVFVINHNLHGVIKAESFFGLSGRPIARYTDILLPLLLLTGYLGLKRVNTLPKNLFVLSSVLALLSFPLIFYSLLPVNNLSLAWLGILQYGLSLLTSSSLAFIFLYVLAVALFSGVVYSLFCHLSLRSFLIFLGIFLALLSVANVFITSYNGQTYWYPREQQQLSLWLADQLPAGVRVVIDKQGCTSRSVEDVQSLCSPEGHTTLLGFWLNYDLVIIDTPQLGDYFISRQRLDYKKIHTTESNIYVYKVE